MIFEEEEDDTSFNIATKTIEIRQSPSILSQGLIDHNQSLDIALARYNQEPENLTLEKIVDSISEETPQIPQKLLK